MTALLFLTVASSVCTGLVGGVFFAFSVFVMRALEQLPREQGVAGIPRSSEDPPNGGKPRRSRLCSCVESESHPWTFESFGTWQ